MNTDQEPPKMSRVVVYLPQDVHRQLKSILALEGSSISEWVRTMAAVRIERSKISGSGLIKKKPYVGRLLIEKKKP